MLRANYLYIAKGGLQRQLIHADISLTRKIIDPHQQHVISVDLRKRYSLTCMLLNLSSEFSLSSVCQYHNIG